MLSAACLDRIDIFEIINNTQNEYHYIYYDRSYVFGTVLEYAIGSRTWHRVYEIYPRPPRAADQFPPV